MIYIAGPIGNGHSAGPKQMYHNVLEGIKTYEALIHKGYTPICPHLSYFAWLLFKGEVDWKTWLEMDLDYVDNCIGVFRMPGDSKGADLEVRHAKKIGKPVYYNLEELPDLSRDYSRVES